MCGPGLVRERVPARGRLCRGDTGGSPGGEQRADTPAVCCMTRGRPLISLSPRSCRPPRRMGARAGSPLSQHPLPPAPTPSCVPSFRNKSSRRGARSEHLLHPGTLWSWLGHGAAPEAGPALTPILQMSRLRPRKARSVSRWGMETVVPGAGPGGSWLQGGVGHCPSCPDSGAGSWRPRKFPNSRDAQGTEATPATLRLAAGTLGLQTG